MGDVRFVLWRTGIVGDHLVVFLLADPIPLENDSKRAQIAVFQHNRSRPNADDFGAEIELALLEFIRQGRKIGNDLARAGDGVVTGRLRQSQPEFAQLAHESLQGIFEIELQMVAGGTPLSPLGNPQPRDGQYCFVPQVDREIVQVGGSCRTDQMLVDLDGSAHQLPSLFAMGVHCRAPLGTGGQGQQSAGPDRTPRITVRLRS
jgi:hypothetical protein